MNTLILRHVPDSLYRRLEAVAAGLPALNEPGGHPRPGGRTAGGASNAAPEP